tara:strand:- start:857 stop:1168 length:312 start_codon:yes stop_codon:yes gene_type:complete
MKSKRNIMKTQDKALSCISLNKNLGESSSYNFIEKSDHDRCFLTFFHSDGWTKEWFPLLMNGRHLRFDEHFCMEIAREKFGHTKFGISDGQQASIGNDCRNNL